MKVQLHCHTDRHSLCAVSSAEEMMLRHIEQGYDAVFLTEHDAFWTERELDQLQTMFPSIAIYSGVEITLPAPEGSVHLLVLGTRDVSLLTTVDTADILARARRTECPTILAHPFRWKGGKHILTEGHRPDAIEHLSQNHGPMQASMSRVTAKRMGLHLVNADDAHHVDGVGDYWIETERDFRSPAELRRILLEGAYINFER